MHGDFRIKRALLLTIAFPLHLSYAFYIPGMPSLQRKALHEALADVRNVFRILYQELQ